LTPWKKPLLLDQYDVKVSASDGSGKKAVLLSLTPGLGLEDP